MLGPENPSGVAGAMAAGLRARGHRADVVVRSPHRFGLPHDRVAGDYRARALEGLMAPARYDVLQYQFGTTHAEFLDAAWARLWRRPLLLMQYWGSDSRLIEIARREFPARARVVDARPGVQRTVRRRLRLAGRLCAAALVPDHELAAYVRGFFDAVYLVPMPVRLPTADPLPELEGDGPIVFHAPSAAAVKGTREILAALDALSAERPLRVRTVSGVSHAEVLAEVARADIVVDQLNSETSGVFALEAMALGKPVLLEYRREVLAPFAQDTPMVRVTAETLAAVVAELCDDPARRAEIGARGREYVARVHASDAVAACLEQLYPHARSRPAGTFVATPQGIRPA